MPTEDLVRQLIASMDVMKKFSNYRMNVFGLNKGEYFMLVSVKEQQDAQDGGGVKISELSKKHQISPPAITQMMNQLEKKGFVYREQDSKDRRIVRIALTEAGEKLLIRAHRAFDSVVTEIAQRIGEEDTKQLIRIFSKLYDIVDEFMQDNGNILKED